MLFSALPDKTAFVYDERLWWKEEGCAYAFDVWAHPGSRGGPRLVGGSSTSFVRANGTGVDPVVLPLKEHPE